MRQLEHIKREWTEFRLNVPWGHISGKWWGSRDVCPVLLLHGWQDSCGTFDTLIPLLPKHLSYLAIDLPGHGRSSHYPLGVASHKIDYVNIILRIVETMKWDRVSLVGHSMGGHAAIWFAAMFPQKMQSLVLLDSLKSPDYRPETFWDMFAAMIDRTAKIDERKQSEDEPPSYPYDECLQRYYDGAFKSIDKDKCMYILERNLKESTKYPGKYYFSRDPRLRMLNDGIFPLEHYRILSTRIMDVPVLYVNAQWSRSFNDDFKSRIEFLRKNPRFEYLDVIGRHHVHLNEPEAISDGLSKFLIKYINDTKKKGKL